MTTLALTSPQLWHLNKAELRPTGSLSGTVTALAYVNPGSEAVSVTAVRTPFCRDFIQARDVINTPRSGTLLLSPTVNTLKRVKME